MRHICSLLLVLLFAILCISATAEEDETVSINELQKSMPTRWDYRNFFFTKPGICMTRVTDKTLITVSMQDTI